MAGGLSWLDTLAYPSFPCFHRFAAAAALLDSSTFVSLRASVFQGQTKQTEPLKRSKI